VAVDGLGRSLAWSCRAVSRGDERATASAEALSARRWDLDGDVGGGGRFEVDVFWESADGKTGGGRPVALTGDTGYFWFFDDSNVEVVIKVLDACLINGQFWVFAGGLADVEAEITVRDTR
jgi:hypothetical protein